MLASLILAFLGTVVAAAGVGVLGSRSYREPRADLIAWLIALLGLTVALGAMTLGFASGFGPVTFRLMEIGAQVVAPIAICLGMAEVAERTLPARFAARLLLPAFGFVALVILSSDPLTPEVAFSKSWPSPRAHFELIPNNLLQYGMAPAVTIVALAGLITVVIRSRHDPRWRDASRAVLLAALAALALIIPPLAVVLGEHAGINLPLSSLFPLLCLAAAALTWAAGMRAGRARTDVLHGLAEYADDDDYGWDGHDPWGRTGETGDFDPVTTGGQGGVYRGDGLYRPEPAGRRPAGGYPDGGPGEVGLAAAGSWAGGRNQGDDRGRAGHAEADDPEARARMFGQIAIYTLLQEGAAEFDRLTERVVEEVRSREPDTLVYIVHGVPSAPLQRILYEVYKDRAAYDEHMQRPYVARFEAERRPCVLATNVIELGLQQAKVSPFPSIADILDQTGAGSIEFIRPDSGRLPPYRPQQPGQYPDGTEHYPAEPGSYPPDADPYPEGPDGYPPGAGDDPYVPEPERYPPGAGQDRYPPDAALDHYPPDAGLHRYPPEGGADRQPAEPDPPGYPPGYRSSGYRPPPDERRAGREI
ncbi:MAG TPA: antibiotic biosynthesis monooxygenase [Streptosporangiaceae bacterium]